MKIRAGGERNSSRLSLWTKSSRWKMPIEKSQSVLSVMRILLVFSEWPWSFHSCLLQVHQWISNTSTNHPCSVVQHPYSANTHVPSFKLNLVTRTSISINSSKRRSFNRLPLYSTVAPARRTNGNIYIYMSRRARVCLCVSIYVLENQTGDKRIPCLSSRKKRRYVKHYTRAATYQNQSYTSHRSMGRRGK
jgi:hypothetical protein